MLVRQGSKIKLLKIVTHETLFFMQVNLECADVYTRCIPGSNLIAKAVNMKRILSLSVAMCFVFLLWPNGMAE